MNSFKNRPYSDIIRWRIRGWWTVIVLLIAYIVVVSVLGGGDSRMMTRTAHNVSQFITWGGMIYAGYRIHYNKKLLGDWQRMKEQRLRENDEHNRWLHDKSGGIVMDIMLVVLLITTDTAALFNMPAFYLSLSVLLTAIALKAGSYLLYRHGIV